MTQAPFHALIYIDRDGAGERRAALRSVHLSYLRDHASDLKAAGPLLDANGSPCGSLLIFQTEFPQALEALASHDPYVTGGVIETVKVARWSISVWALNSSPLQG